MKVRDDPEHRRYVVSVDGRDAGYAHYTVRDGVVVFTHTTVDPEWEGRGVGSALARGALDDVVGTGRTFAPYCPFIAAYVDRHPEYAPSAVD
jgi:predicted GNAT family acetyltransferase